MRAVVFDRPGDEQVLRIDEVEAPRPGPGELCLKVAAAGVNRADLLQRRGLYPPPPGASDTLGLECAGTVAELGDGVEGWSLGDRAMALLPGGGYAEQVTVAASSAMPVPERLSLEAAAGAPEVFLTAFLNLFMLARLGHGELALVHGGSGGVGTAAIQLCREAGNRVIVTAGSDERCLRCLELGAAAAINYHDDDLEQLVNEAAGNQGLDVVLDCIGGAYLDMHTSLLDKGGRLVVIGLMGGRRAELDLARVLGKNLEILGSTLRSRSIESKAELVRQFRSRFGSALESGAVEPCIDQTIPWQDVAGAHQRLASGEVFGKVVLKIS